MWSKTEKVARSENKSLFKLNDFLTENIVLIVELRAEMFSKYSLFFQMRLWSEAKAKYYFRDLQFLVKS